MTEIISIFNDTMFGGVLITSTAVVITLYVVAEIALRHGASKRLPVVVQATAAGAGAVGIILLMSNLIVSVCMLGVLLLASHNQVTVATNISSVVLAISTAMIIIAATWIARKHRWLVLG